MIKDEGAACKDLRYTSQNPSAKIEDAVTAKTPPQGCNNGGADGVITANPNGLTGDPMDQDNNTIVGGEKDNLWLDGDSQENLLGVNESSIFYTDFPSLPDFPCMSSSSSSSSNPKPLISASSSSSSAASSSWAAVRSSDADERCTGNLVKAEHNSGGGAALSSTASMEVQPPLSDLDCCIDDAMENFGYMDLIDVNEIWDDPSNSVFDGGDDIDQQNPIQEFENHPQSMIFDASPQEQTMMMHHQQQQTCGEDDGLGSLLEGNSELGMIFFEWLKQNREYITAEEMRSIRLKRATIETATKRLGNTIEGKKRLLRLILDWIEKCQLQKKKVAVRENGSTSQEQLNNTYPEAPQLQNATDLDQNPNPNDPNQSFPYNHHPMANDPSACFSTQPWIQPPPPPPQEAVQVMASYPPQPVPMYPCDHPYSNAVQIPPMVHHQVMSNGPIPHPNFGEYPVMDHPQSWAMPPPPYTIPAQPQMSPYPDRAAPIVTHQPAFYPSPYPMYDPNGERLVRLGASATKEARKKRMARQRRVLSSHHHQRHSGHANHHQLLQDQMMGDADLIGDDHHVAEDKMISDQAGSSGNNWMYNWSSSGGGTGTSANADSAQPSAADRVSVQPQNNQRQGSSDRKQQQQGWKTEKNLKFLLQKVLKQSDVGNLGRIVLPKKEAESHLPELETRDGISVAMEDIGTSRVWNMRYRFWPNNKSRMYLLENTGDFVRVNGLQEGDFIVIYSDTKCGKYMIRGVKVRPGAKQESKKPVRKNSRSLSIGGGNNSSSLAQIKQALD